MMIIELFNSITNIYICYALLAYDFIFTLEFKDFL